MAFNRYQQNTSPWAAGAPPSHMYGGPPGHPGHPGHPPPPPQHNMYSAPPTYSHQTAWGPNTAMRQTQWGGPSQVSNAMPAQQRPMRGMSGPTGKRGGYSNWQHEGPPKKRLAGNRGPGGGNWQNKNDNRNQRFNQRGFGRDRRPNNREVSRSKTNNSQAERRQQHDQAQKNAESLQKKEYPVQKPANKDENAKNDKAVAEIDPAHERYVKTVFGYVCNVCNVFLKDKTAKAEHCLSEEHLTSFKTAEEERVQKEQEVDEKKESEPAKDESDNAGDNAEGNVTQEGENGNVETVTQENQVSTDDTNKGVSDDVENLDVNESEIKEDKQGAAVDGNTDAISQPNDDSKTESSVQGTPKPSPVISKTAQPLSGPTFQKQGGDFPANRGRGYPRGRGGHGRGSVPRGRGRNRGRGRK